MESKVNPTPTTGKLIDNKDFIVWLSNFSHDARTRAIKNAIFNVLRDRGVKENHTLKAALTQISLCCKVHLERLPPFLFDSNGRLKQCYFRELLNDGHALNSKAKTCSTKLTGVCKSKSTSQNENSQHTTKSAVTKFEKNDVKKEHYDSKSEKIKATIIEQNSGVKRKSDDRKIVISKRSKTSDELKDSKNRFKFNMKEVMSHCRSVKTEIKEESDEEDDCKIVSVTYPNKPDYSPVVGTGQGVCQTLSSSVVRDASNSDILSNSSSLTSQGTTSKDQTIACNQSEFVNIIDVNIKLPLSSKLKENNNRHFDTTFTKTNQKEKQEYEKPTLNNENVLKDNPEIIIIDDDDNDDDDDDNALHIVEDNEVERVEEPSSNVGKIRIKDISTLMAKPEPPVISAVTQPDSESVSENKPEPEAPAVKIPRYLLEAFCKKDVQFLKLVSSTFNELVNSKIEIMGSILHLGISEYLCKGKRMELAEQLSHPNAILWEKEKLLKDFRDSMKQRGIEFSALLGSIVNKFDIGHIEELFVALYVKLEFALLKIDFHNHSNLNLIKPTLNYMLNKNNFKNETLTSLIQEDRRNDFQNLYVKVSALVKFCNSLYITEDSKVEKFNPFELEKQQDEANITVQETNILPMQKSVIQSSQRQPIMNPVSILKCNNIDAVPNGPVVASTPNNKVNNPVIQYNDLSSFSSVNNSTQVNGTVSNTIHFKVIKQHQTTNTLPIEKSNVFNNSYQTTNTSSANIPLREPSASKQTIVNPNLMVRENIVATTPNRNLLVVSNNSSMSPVNVSQAIGSSPSVQIPVIVVSNASSPLTYKMQVTNTRPLIVLQQSMTRH